MKQDAIAERSGGRRPPAEALKRFATEIFARTGMRKPMRRS